MTVMSLYYRRLREQAYQQGAKAVIVSDEASTPKRFGIDNDQAPDAVLPFVSVGGGRWNGWYSPFVTRCEAERVVAYLNAAYAEHDASEIAVSYRFDGVDIVETAEGCEYRSRPLPDGTYDVGFGLCWVSDDQWTRS